MPDEKRDDITEETDAGEFEGAEGEADDAENPEQYEREREGFDWYVLKVATNREESIRDAIVRQAKVHGLTDRIGRVIVPTETLTEMKSGKKRTVKRKIYPGYVMIHMKIDDDTWFMVRETSGVGDFIGTNRKPTPMAPEEVDRVLAYVDRRPGEEPVIKIDFKVGDRVKIKEGPFENFDGELVEVITPKGLIRVVVTIFGRETPVELEYWQVEAL